MEKSLRIGMIGTDTSHFSHFAKYLNDPEAPHRIEGGKLTVAYPGGSEDFELSRNRVEKYSTELRDEYGVLLVDSPEKVAEACDAIILTSVDGRVHLEQFQRIASYGKPVFIDKPFAVSSAHAQAIADLAAAHGVPLFSSSSIRYMDQLQAAVASIDAKQSIYGADVFGPMELQETQPGLYWYGIHSVDVLYQIMGPGCEKVQAFKTEEHEFVVGHWHDGRVGTVRGNRKGNNTFGVSIHTTSEGPIFVPNQSDNACPPYVRLLERIMDLFTTGQPAVAITETLEVIRFIEAANESRLTGNTVFL